jgi:hypothetical protein
MAPAQSKFTIHPWLDAPIYNRIRFPQWKIYLYNAAQKMCTSLDITEAFSLVALDANWDLHPKNAIPAVAATANAPAVPVPASLRPRPVIDMPVVYTRAATTFDREMFKLEKERFEKFDEAETILHAAIMEMESLSPGTVRTINTSTPSGIAALSAGQLVGLVHTLFSTPKHNAGHPHCLGDAFFLLPVFDIKKRGRGCFLLSKSTFDKPWLPGGAEV